MAEENKNLLVISNNSFSEILNNGKTYESLFKHWPQNNIAQLFFCTNEYPDFHFCRNYFQITEIEIFKSILSLNIYKPGNIVRSINYSYNLSVAKNESPFLKYIKKHAKTLAVFRDLLWALNYWKTKKLRNWIEDFNPDFIFYISGDVGYTHNIVQWINKEYKIPYAVYFTDDYVINQYSDNLLQTIHQKTILRKYLITIANASKCYAIGQLMASDYSKKYSKEFLPLVNCIDFETISKNKEIPEDDKIVFSFIGGLHLKRWQSLVELGSLLKEFQNEFSIKCVVNIYTIIEPEKSLLKLLNTPPLIYLGALDSESVLRKIHESNILIHVESFEKKYRLYTKYSISTKIPEYLASQRAVLGFGPNEIASIRLLSDNKIGVVLTDLDTRDEKKVKLEKLIQNSEFRDTICRAAYSYAKANFDAIEVRRDLKASLSEMAKY